MVQLLFSILVWRASASEMYAYPVQKIPLRGVTEIKIVGINGHLNLRGRGRSTSLNLKVSHSKNRKYDDWQLQVERRENVLFLEVFNVAYGKAWNKQVRGDLFPEFDIDIDGPSLPVTVAWREGALRFTDWKNKIDASFLKGSAVVAGGSGILKLQPVEGNIEVDRHDGNLDLNGQSGHVRLSRGSGDLKVNWLSGKIQIDQWQGHTSIEAQSAELNASGIRGAFNAKVEEGHAHLSTSAEDVKIEGGKCAWEITAEAPANVNVSSATGPVQVHWKGGGQVFLASKRGPVEIQHSDFLSVVKKDGSHVAEGRKIMPKMGQVFVRTESGRIRWRQ